VAVGYAFEADFGLGDIGLVIEVDFDLGDFGLEGFDLGDSQIGL